MWYSKVAEISHAAIPRNIPKIAPHAIALLVRRVQKVLRTIGHTDEPMNTPIAEYTPLSVT